MKITFVKHSGFLLEWEQCVWLIDYYHGRIPAFDEEKKVMVFCSHKHTDHFNAKVFQICKEYKKVEYVLSSDIEPAVDELKLSPRQLQQITYVSPEQTSRMGDGTGNEVVVKTLNSTDCGVAFLLEYQGKTIYHAGDLNCWVWKGEPESETRRMTAAYLQELRALKKLSARIDAAFVPLDPRQEEWYAKGLLQFLAEVGARKVFPMHFWGRHELIKQFLNSDEGREYQNCVVPIDHSGESWEI